MDHLIVLEPLPIAAVSASRGDGSENLLLPSPKDVWLDTASGSIAQISIDLGSVTSIDTVFLGSIIAAHSGATWRIQGGTTGYTQQNVAPTQALKVADVVGRAAERSAALHFGESVDLRYLRLSITQTANQPPISIGSLMVGKAFQAASNIGWGAGRRIIDTGTATPLPDGGFEIVEGARKASFSWGFRDLSSAEVEQLFEIQRECGETRPVLVIENPANTAGLINRIHYGKFVSLKQYERRNVVQTRWEMTVEQWV